MKEKGESVARMRGERSNETGLDAYARGLQACY